MTVELSSRPRASRGLERPRFGSDASRASARRALSPRPVSRASNSSAGCSESSSAVSMFRCFSISGVDVFTSIPSSQRRTHEAASVRSPTSTTHIRHTPTGANRGSWHSTGISIAQDRLASKSVVPACTRTRWPSMVSSFTHPPRRRCPRQCFARSPRGDSLSRSSRVRCSSCRSSPAAVRGKFARPPKRRP